MANQNSKKKTNSQNKKTNTNKANTNNKKVVTKNNKKKEEKVVVKNEVKEVKQKKVENKKKVTIPKKEIVAKEVVNETKTVEKGKKSFELTPKQRDIILILLVVVLLIVALVVTSNRTPKLDIELPIALEGTAGFNEITYSEYLEKMEEKVPFLVVIVKDGCGYCEMYEPILEEVAGEYNLPINYINLTNLTEEEYNDLSKSNSYLRTNQWGTPTTLFMYGTTVVDSIGGYVEKDSFVSFIETNFKVEKNAEE